MALANLILIHMAGCIYFAKKMFNWGKPTEVFLARLRWAILGDGSVVII